MDVRKLIPVLMLGLFASLPGCSAPSGLNLSWLPWVGEKDVKSHPAKPQPARPNEIPSTGERRLSVEKKPDEDGIWKSSLIAGFKPVDVVANEDQSNSQKMSQSPALAGSGNGPITEGPEGSLKANRLQQFANPFEDPVSPTAIARRRYRSPESSLEERFRRAGIDQSSPRQSPVAARPVRNEHPRVESATPLLTQEQSEVRSAKPLIQQQSREVASPFRTVSQSRILRRPVVTSEHARMATAEPFIAAGDPTRPEPRKPVSAISRLLSRNERGPAVAAPSPAPAREPEPALRHLLQPQDSGLESASPQPSKSALDRFREVNGIDDGDSSTPQRRLSI